MQYNLTNTLFLHKHVSYIRNLQSSTFERGGWFTYQIDNDNIIIHSMFECKNVSDNADYEFIPDKNIGVLIKLLWEHYINKRKIGQYHNHPMTTRVIRSEQDIIQHNNMMKIYPEFAMMIISTMEIKTYINDNESINIT